MKLFLFAIGARDRASSRLRVWDHVTWLGEQGHVVVADSLTPLMADLTRGSLLRRVLGRLPRWVGHFFAADAIVIQEVLLLWPLLALRNLGKRRRVVFDFSDPIDRSAGGRGLKATLRRFAFRRMVAGADVTIVENPGYLAALAPLARKVDQFYGPVDAQRYREGRLALPPRVERPERPLRIGWTGSPGTYRFIAPLVPIIDRAAAHRTIELVLIGVTEIPERTHHVRVTLLPWNEAEEFALVPSFDLGLFRLEPTEDARWRGAGKLFIYMAAGVPFLATDAGIAHGVVKEFGTGFGVPSDADWAEVLDLAMEQEQERRRMAQASMELADAHLSYQAWRHKLSSNLCEPGEGA